MVCRIGRTWCAAGCCQPLPSRRTVCDAQEIGFSSFFRNYFVNNDLYAAVMVWRFFTYYLIVIGGALLVVIDQLWYRKKKLREALEAPQKEE